MSGILVQEGSLGSWSWRDVWDLGPGGKSGILVLEGCLGSWAWREVWDPGPGEEILAGGLRMGSARLGFFPV
jgi:hypothetical protein